MSNPDWTAIQRELWQLLQTTIAQRPGSAAEPGIPNSFWRGLNLDSTSPDTLTAWLTSNLENLFKQGGAQQSASANPFSALFQSPFANWSGGSAAFGIPSWPPFGNGSAGSAPFGVPPWTPSEFVGPSDLPPLGLTREWELAWRDLQQANAEQLKSSGALGRQLSTVYQTALKRFLSAINRNDGEADITNLRELYDLWVSIAEQTYAEKVMTEDYSRAFGGFINASARSRQAWQKLTNNFGEAMNLPNRRELDSIIENQHALRTELNEIAKPDLANVDFEKLRKDVSELTAKLEKLGLDAGAARSNASTRKKASTTRKRPSSQRNKAVGAAKSKSKRKPAGQQKQKSPPPGDFDIGSILNAD